MLRTLAMIGLCSLPIHALAQICPASNAIGLSGIGDGCTTQSAEWVFPSVGIFKGTFTPSCDFHDKCYSQLGADYHQCDSAFYEKMRAACNSKYNEYLQPVEWSACRSTAYSYYYAVSQWGSTAATQYNMQSNARDRSWAMESTVAADTCGTTPERTTIYAPALITQVNNAFLASAGRLPTVYEFFRAVNSGDIVNDRNGWTTVLYNHAAAAAGVAPPAVGWVKTHPTLYSYKFTASPNLAGVNYLWKVMQITATGPSLTLTFRPPERSWAPQMNGFIRATNSAGVKNMAVIETSGWLIGTSCSPSGPPVSCE
jgi:hypothetical protein